MRAPRIALPICLCLLAACGGDKAETTTTPTTEGLPRPAAAGQSVTGMPDPGVASPRPAPASAQAPEIIDIPEPEPADEAALDPVLLPAPEIAPAPATPPTEPAPTVAPPAPTTDPTAPPTVEPQQ